MYPSLNIRTPYFLQTENVYITQSNLYSQYVDGYVIFELDILNIDCGQKGDLINVKAVTLGPKFSIEAVSRPALNMVRVMLR